MLLLSPVFDISMMIYFNITITPLAFDNNNVSLIQIFCLHTWDCLPYFFSASKLKMDSYIKTFIENRLAIKRYQIHESVTVRSMKCLMVMTMMMMMLMNCFCGMVERRKVFSLISSQDHCQRSSPSRISDTPRAGFEPAQNWLC